MRGSKIFLKLILFLSAKNNMMTRGSQSATKNEEASLWKNAPVPEGTPYGTRCVSLGCSSKLIHLEVHDEPLVSFYRELTLCP